MTSAFPPDASGSSTVHNRVGVMILDLGHGIGFSQLFTGVLVAYLYFERDPKGVSVGWLAVVILVLLVQARLVHKERAKGRTSISPGFEWQYVAINTISGVVWGLGCWIFVDVSDVSGSFFYMMLLGGALATIAATQFLAPKAALCTIWAVPLTGSPVFFFKGFEDAIQIALATGVFAIVMSELVRRLYKLAASRVELEIEKDALVAQIGQSLTQVQDAQAARTRYLAQSSHDLRQPLHAASLYAEAMSERQTGADDPLLPGLMASLDTLGSMFDGLLTLSHLETGAVTREVEAVDLGALVAEVVAANLSMAEEADTALRYVETTAHVETDPSLVLRIAQNLIGNAIRYAPGAGVLVGFSRTKGGLSLQVTDNGPGISVEDQERVFEEFTRSTQVTELTQQGLGLGLTIVNRAADILGVTVDLLSEPGKGSTFLVGPFLYAAAPARALAEPAAHHHDDRALSILVLDDDPAAADALSRILTSWGYRVEVAASPDAVQSPLRHDLLISDHDLKADRTGLDVIEALQKSQSGGVPAIVISGSADPSIADRAEALNVALLQKPVKSVQLRSAMLQELTVDTAQRGDH